ncbi:hypothetical protein EJ110_NYTH56137 [Nymphaea thermarum]|nr:hypothetical protein EJ110_NYTH56137 [Nymphaea thermarum]
MSGSLSFPCGEVVALLSKSANIAAPVVVHGFPLQNHLLEKLADCRCMDYARSIFDPLHVVNDFSLNIMIKNYAINGRPENSILLHCLLYCEMLENCIKQSNFTFAMMVGDCLICFHASFHSIDDAKHIFGEMPERDLLSWNSIISVCVSVSEVELAHQLLNEIPMLRNVISWIAQVDGYGQAGRPAEVVHLFVKMLISAANINPNSAIMVQSVVPNEAIRLFDQMYEEEMKPNEITMVSLLSACAVLEAGQRKQMELRKPAGSSCVEVDRTVHSIANSTYMLWPSATQSSYALLALLPRDPVPSLFRGLLLTILALMVIYCFSLVIVFLGHLLPELVVCSFLWTATAAALTSATSFLWLFLKLITRE